jgi:hypothetical protein
MKTSKIITSLAIAFSLGLVANTAQASLFSSFTDADSFSSWFADSAYKMEFNEIITGHPDGEFNATDNVNRAELAVILDRFSERVVGKTLDSEPFACTAQFVYGLELQIIDQEGNPIEGVQVTSSQDEKAGPFSTGSQEGWYSGLGEAAGQSDLTLEKEGYVTHYDSVTLEDAGCHVDSQRKTIMMVKKVK